MDPTIAQAKAAARTLRLELQSLGLELGHSQALELVARQAGMHDWNTAAATFSKRTVGLGNPVPVLRIYDEAVAQNFFKDYLGFHVEWEHRFEEGLPLYARMRRDQCVLDISGHYGDGAPGAVVWVPLSDVRSLHKELLKHTDIPLRPAIDKHAPGGPTLDIIDPFGNTLRFCQTNVEG